MKLCSVVYIIFASSVAYGQWTNRVYLEDDVKYFNNVVQETFLELEERGFCNLKLVDITQSISQQMYKWHVVGNITYTNGYLVSMQKVDVTDIQQLTSSRTVDGEVHTVATVRGNVNLRDVKIGYDVIAELGDDGDHRFTGTFVHTLIRYQFSIMKTLNTQNIEVSQFLSSLSGGLGRMIYMPANNITQVISRTYVPSNAWDGVGGWARNYILPVMTDVVLNKIEFPPVCLDCR